MIKFQFEKSEDGWNFGIHSTKIHEFLPGFSYPGYGIAFLFYRPKHRLSISVWTNSWSHNIRLWGPRTIY